MSPDTVTVIANDTNSLFALTAWAERNGVSIMINMHVDSPNHDACITPYSEKSAIAYNTIDLPFDKGDSPYPLERMGYTGEQLKNLRHIRD